MATQCGLTCSGPMASGSSEGRKKSMLSTMVDGLWAESGHTNHTRAPPRKVTSMYDVRNPVNLKSDNSPARSSPVVRRRVDFGSCAWAQAAGSATEPHKRDRDTVSVCPHLRTGVSFPMS